MTEVFSEPRTFQTVDAFLSDIPPPTLLVSAANSTYGQNFTKALYVWHPVVAFFFLLLEWKGPLLFLALLSNDP